MQAAIAELIDTGEFHRHFNKAMRIYEERRRVFATLLDRHFGPSARFTIPDGGLAYWIEFDNPFGTASFAAKARAAGVRLLPGRMFTNTPDRRHSTQLGYARFTPLEMEEGLRRLRRAASNTTPKPETKGIPLREMT